MADRRDQRAAALPAPHEFVQPEEFKDAAGATILSVLSLEEAIDALKRVSKPFLNWAGKAERLSFDVPTLPLFVHERLSTQKIVKTLIGHKADRDRINTIRVDSKVVSETDTGHAKSEESQWMRFTLDTVGKTTWPRDPQGRAIYPEGFEELARKRRARFSKRRGSTISPT